MSIAIREMQSKPQWNIEISLHPSDNGYYKKKTTKIIPPGKETEKG